METKLQWLSDSKLEVYKNPESLEFRDVILKSILKGSPRDYVEGKNNVPINTKDYFMHQIDLSIGILEDFICRYEVDDQLNPAKHINNFSELYHAIEEANKNRIEELQNGLLRHIHKDFFPAAIYEFLSYSLNPNKTKPVLSFVREARDYLKTKGTVLYSQSYRQKFIDKFPTIKNVFDKVDIIAEDYISEQRRIENWFLGWTDKNGDTRGPI